MGGGRGRRREGRERRREGRGAIATCIIVSITKHTLAIKPFNY